MTNQIDMHPEQLRRFAVQVERAATHVDVLRSYAGIACAETDGLENLLAVFADLTEDVAEVNMIVLKRSRDALSRTADDITLAVDLVEQTDVAAAQRIGAAFPPVPKSVPFPDLTTLPGSVHGYDDVTSTCPGLPATSSEKYTADGIDPGGLLGTFDDLWRSAFGESVLAKIFHPILGDPGRLAWLSSAYSQLGTCTYEVAWNLRSGTLNAAPHWNGESGRAFELCMFRWHMGLGGLGDAHHLIAKLYLEAYEVVSKEFREILELLNRLLEKVGKRLTPVIGQLSLLWDVVTWDVADELKEFVNDVKRIVRKINELEEECMRFKEKILEAQARVEQLLLAARDPHEALRDWAGKTQDGILNFEGRSGYDPTPGAARVALLPI
ncbi:hypothetical protein AAH979_31170 [Plantactinospora sp. ZYX-F-223]|uniref:hypothetical protein n=1 Tax=Plantactinospora sp. ZYX-F-223 TaxID=3144103 RepID=UPI0031FDD4B8